MRLTERLKLGYGVIRSGLINEDQRLKSSVTIIRNGQQLSTGPRPDDAGIGQGYTSSVKAALKNAYKNPTVCAVVDWITDQTATTPYMLSRTDADGEVEVVPAHPLLDLLRTPSEFMSGRELLSVSIFDAILCGQFFWLKDQTRSGQIGGLKYLQARHMEVKGSAEQLITEYEYSSGGSGSKKVTYRIDEIVHVRIKPDPFDPKNGLSPLACVGSSLMIDSETGEYISSALTSQGAPGGLLMPRGDEILSEEVAAQTKQYIQGEFARSKRGRLGVLRAAMDYINTSLDASANTLRQIKNMTQEEICGVLGVHPVILGLGAGSAQSRVGAATEVLEAAAWANRIIPMEDAFGEQIGRQLLPDFEPDDTDEWELGFDRSRVPVLQPDMKREAERWSIAIKAGYATVYDARAAQEMETDEDEQYYLRAANVVAVPMGAPPEPPVAEPVEAPEEQEPEEQSLVQLAALAVFGTKADLDETQRDLLLALAQDAETLEGDFTSDLAAAFEDLGERAVAAFWEVDGGESLQAIGNGAQTKQTPAEIQAEADAIARAIKIQQWVQSAMGPLYDAYYLRVLLSTVDTVSTSLSLAVNIPDPVGRSVVQQGGTRLGLIDFNQQTRDSLYRALFEGRSNGEGPAQLARRIQGTIPPGPYKDPTYRSRLIARTETKYAQNVSTLESYRAAETITHVLCVDSQGAGPVDAECAAVDGRQYTFAEADALGQLEHPNCTRSWSPVVGK